MLRSAVALGTWTLVSTALQLSNRVLLGSLAFPGLGLLALAQNAVILAVCLSQWRSLVWPRELRRVVWLGVCSGISQLLGLAASGFLVLSMFGVLRRTSMVVALLVGLWHGEKHGRLTQLSVAAMAAGAVVASASDVSFHAVGYAAVLLDNIFTVLQRQVLSSAPDLPWATLLLCQALFALPLLLVFCAAVQWTATADSVAVLLAAPLASPVVAWFAASAVLGVALSLSVMWAVSRVTPLSLSVAGAAKNNVLTMAAMLWSGLPNAQNVAGITVSIAANVAYVWSKSRV